jgi:hypothetical protein
MFCVVLPVIRVVGGDFPDRVRRVLGGHRRHQVHPGGDRCRQIAVLERPQMKRASDPEEHCLHSRRAVHSAVPEARQVVGEQPHEPHHKAEHRQGKQLRRDPGTGRHRCSSKGAEVARAR